MKTDSQLRQDVMAELKWKPVIHAEQIGGEVKDDTAQAAENIPSWSSSPPADAIQVLVEGGWPTLSGNLE